MVAAGPGTVAGGSAHSATRVRLDRLTALRWVAALLVFGCHVNPTVLLDPGLGHLSDPGVSGVDFFFVLSGFVLAWSYRGTDTAASFYRRRAARILPLYLLTWVAALVESATAAHGSTVAQQLPSLFLVQAWVPRYDVYFAGAVVLWSLSCEAFFYLLFPALIRPLQRLSSTQLLAIATAAIVIAVAVPLLLHPADNDDGIRYWLTYPFPVYRLCEFVLGVAVAILTARRALPRVPFLAAAALALIAYVASGWAPLYVQTVAVPVVPVSLLIVAAAQADIEGRAAPPRWLVRLGEWSFAFYLCQLIVMRVVEGWVQPTGLGERATLSVALLLLCVAVAAGLCEIVEKPLERRLRGDGSLPVTLGDDSRAFIGRRPARPTG